MFAYKQPENTQFGCIPIETLEWHANMGMFAYKQSENTQNGNTSIEDWNEMRTWACSHTNNQERRSMVASEQKHVMCLRISPTSQKYKCLLPYDELTAEHLQKWKVTFKLSGSNPFLEDFQLQISYKMYCVYCSIHISKTTHVQTISSLKVVSFDSNEAKKFYL